MDDFIYVDDVDDINDIDNINNAEEYITINLEDIDDFDHMEHMNILDINNQSNITLDDDDDDDDYTIIKDDEFAVFLENTELYQKEHDTNELNQYSDISRVYFQGLLVLFVMIMRPSSIFCLNILMFDSIISCIRYIKKYYGIKYLSIFRETRINYKYMYIIVLILFVTAINFVTWWHFSELVNIIGVILSCPIIIAITSQNSTYKEIGFIFYSIYRNTLQKNSM